MSRDVHGDSGWTDRWTMEYDVVLAHVLVEHVMVAHVICYDVYFFLTKLFYETTTLALMMPFLPNASKNLNGPY
jgi:hypothetical protein